MINVAKLAEKIKNNCFTQEEINILEFSINQRRITIEKQIKEHFKLAWYRYDEEELYDAFILVKEQNKDLLEQIKEYRRIIDISFNPYSYQLFRNSDIEKEDDRLSASGSNSNTTNKATNRNDIITNDYQSNQDLTQQRNANSQTNVTKPLSAVWEDWKLENNEKTIDKLTDGPNIREYTIQSKTIPATEPTEHKELEHTYQYFDKQESLNKGFVDTHTNTHSGSRDESTSDVNSRNVGVSNMKGTRKLRSTEYSLGENMLKIAQIELPKYRGMFWSKFNQIFLTKWD